MGEKEKKKKKKRADSSGSSIRNIVRKFSDTFSRHSDTSNKTQESPVQSPQSSDLDTSPRVWRQPIQVPEQATYSSSPESAISLRSALNPRDKMNVPRARTTMLMPPSGSVPPMIRDKARNDAKDYQQVIEASLKGSGLDFNYKLIELIGKGSYGRVYLAHHKKNKMVVAIKILNIEALDAECPREPRGLHDSQIEIDILARLRDFQTINVAKFVEAFPAHEHLCIVSEYCSGGSVSTLRRALTQGRLDEKYIRPIARELAFALRSVHAAGIVHRDVKGSNVMIDENGKVQLIDFGIAALVKTTMPEDKRKTVIGTPHWMPPELHVDRKDIPYGMEVDVWSYGITIYECAMGAPPNAGIAAGGRQLRTAIRRSPARLNDESFSPELRDLIAFVLEPDTAQRPTMEEVCQHPYILNTEEDYPTEILQELVQQYVKWESQGGVRSSLWMPGGAEKVDPSKMQSTSSQDDGWNFSTSDDFIKRMSRIDPDFNLAYDPFSPAIPEVPEFGFSNSPPPEDDYFDGQYTARYNDTHAESSWVVDDRRVTSNLQQPVPGNAERGGRKLANLFNGNEEEYQYQYGKASDLPLRQGGQGPVHHQELSVSSNNGRIPAINLEDVSNKKRTTMNWTWNEGVAAGTPSAIDNRNTADFFSDFPQSRQQDARQSDFFADLAPPSRPTLDRAATMPVGNEMNDQRRETLDLDALMGPSADYSYAPGVHSGPGSFTHSVNNSHDFDNLNTSMTAGHGIGFGGTTTADTGDSYVQEPLDSFEAEMAATGQGSNYATMRPVTYAEPDRRSHQTSTSQLPADLVSSPAGSTFDDVDSYTPGPSSQYPPPAFGHIHAHGNNDEWTNGTSLNGGIGSSAYGASDHAINDQSISVEGEAGPSSGPSVGGSQHPKLQSAILPRPRLPHPAIFENDCPDELFDAEWQHSLRQVMQGLQNWQIGINNAAEQDLADLDRIYGPDSSSGEEGDEGEEEDEGYEGGQESFEHGDDADEDALGDANEGESIVNGVNGTDGDESSHSA